MTHYLFICCLLISGTVKAADLEASVGEKRGASALALEQAPPQRQRVEAEEGGDSLSVTSHSARDRSTSSSDDFTSATETSTSRGQLYCVPTYDAAFKYILSAPEIRQSFLETFAPGIDAASVEPLDEHMNPLKKFTRLREFVFDKKNLRARAALKEHRSDIDVRIKGKKSAKATAFLKGCVEHFKDMKKAFSKPKYDGAMDLVCQLKNGDYVLVEMQVKPQKQWDERALIYAASFYGRQLRVGDSWEKRQQTVKKVMAINILGGGRRNYHHWKESPTEYVRRYKFMEEGSLKTIMNGIELHQYSIMNAEGRGKSEAEGDWLTFFRRAHQFRSEREVLETIKTAAVRKAFERALLEKLPAKVKERYDSQAGYASSDEDIEYARKKGERIGLEKGEILGRIKTLLELNFSYEDIITKTPGLTAEQLQEIKADIAVEQSSPASIGNRAVSSREMPAF